MNHKGVLRYPNDQAPGLVRILGGRGAIYAIFYSSCTGSWAMACYWSVTHIVLLFLAIVKGGSLPTYRVEKFYRSQVHAARRGLYNTKSSY